MVQVAAALLFAVAAGLGITVILAMLRTNRQAILSSLAGEGAFPLQGAPQPGPAHVVTLRRPGASREARRPLRVSGRMQPPVSRAA